MPYCSHHRCIIQLYWTNGLFAILSVNCLYTVCSCTILRENTSLYLLLSLLPLPIILLPSWLSFFLPNNSRSDTLFITRKKCRGIDNHMVAYYTTFWPHSIKYEKILLGNTFFIQFSKFKAKNDDLVKSQFGVVIFDSIPFFNESL